MKSKKEITLNDLALMMSEGFERAEKRTDKKIENLARMVAAGFEETNENMKKMETRLEAKITKVKDDTENIKSDLNKKVDKFTHKSLEFRVEKLEKKFA